MLRARPPSPAAYTPRAAFQRLRWLACVLQPRRAMSTNAHRPVSGIGFHLPIRSIAAILRAGLVLTISSQCVQAQIVINQPAAMITIEGYGNLTGGGTVGAAGNQGSAPETIAFDGAARVLARFTNPTGPNIGVRVVAEGSSDKLRVSEASLLLFGSGGRLEIGKRMGLPDVLTGYAPNSFTFTTAEFGPPTGRTLDPGGGLQTQFLRTALRSRLESLAARGVTASLFNDESAKILYVLPKHNGWLAGASFSLNAEDGRFDRLAQLGVVHETYWHQNIWRWGGTYAHARARPRDGVSSYRDLDSVSFGTSVSLNDSLDIGVSGSYDGNGGTVRSATGWIPAPAWGGSASLNYNTGPWTVGGYYQLSRESQAADAAERERLSAFELGASYRVTTRLRLYGAWFFYNLTNDGRGRDAFAGSGSVFTLGFRATL
jgi:hypothetical protein